MFRLIAGCAGLVAALSVAATYCLPLLGAPNWFVGLLAAAAAVCAGALAASSRDRVAPGVFWAAVGVSALALVVFGFGLATSLVVDGRVVSYNSTQAAAARQIADLRADAATLSDAAALLSASASEQFARAGQSAQMSETCTALLKKWDRIPPAAPGLTEAVVAMKDGASACAQGTKISSQSSATPDEQTRTAIAAAANGVRGRTAIIDETTAQVAGELNLVRQS